MQLNPRGKFLLLAGIFVVPVVAAWLAMLGWRPAAHANYGDLLPVTPLRHTAGALSDGTPYDVSRLKGKWVMVYLGGAACDADCRAHLYLMRQTRIAQGKEQSRIERLWVLTDAGVADARLLGEHPGLYAWRPGDADFAGQFPPATPPGAGLYLVDPLGNLMLRFPARPDARRMMKDLRLLLKASQIG